MTSMTKLQLEIMQAMSELLWAARVKDLSLIETERRFQQLCRHFRDLKAPSEHTEVEAELKRWGDHLASLRQRAFLPQAI